MNEKKLIKAWKYVDKYAKEKGFGYWDHNNEYQRAGATITTISNDKFVPIFNLNIWWGQGLSIHVEDRNGNDILDGPTCAVHILNDCKDFEKKLEKMCDYVFGKYSQYSRENRLDFRFNNLTQERIEWHKEISI